MDMKKFDNEVGCPLWRWEVFERWSATAFVVAGIAWLADTLLVGLELVRLSPAGVVSSGLVLVGMWCSMLGLIGLHRRLADRAPRLALASTLVAALGGAAIVVQLVWGAAAFAFEAIANPPGLTTLVLGILVVGGFGSFGLGSVYTGRPPRTVGVLLLVLLVVFVGAAVSTAWVQFGLEGVLSGVSFALGSLLSTGAPRSQPEQPSSDSVS